MVDLAFFEDSHDACAHTIFHSGLLLVRGTIQRRGGRNTVTGSMVWDLDDLAAARRDHGPEAVHRLLGPDATPTPATRSQGRCAAAHHPAGDRSRTSPLGRPAAHPPWSCEEPCLPVKGPD